MSSVLVVGCGYVGEVVADRLFAEGRRVVGWTHSEASAARLAGIKPYRVVACDVSDPAQVAAAGARDFDAGFETIISCVSAGRGGGPAEYGAVYLEGARNLRDAFPAARLIFTSSTSVYAQTDGGWVDENSPANPDRETGRILRAAEELVLATGTGIVARLAGIYGPGRSALLRRWLAGDAVIEGDGGRWLNQIHRDDAAAALQLLVRADAAPGVYLVADDLPITQLELYRALAARSGQPLPPSGPVDPNRKRGWTSKRVSNRRLRAMGWSSTHPSFVAWAATQLAQPEVG